MPRFICGTGNFPEEDTPSHSHSHSHSLSLSLSLPSTPKKSSPNHNFIKRKSFNKSKDNKNPYSSGGLDRFNSLLAELEEKKQKIYAHSKDVSLIRFVYSNNNECIPIVVKVKEDKKKLEKQKQSKNRGIKPATKHEAAAEREARRMEEPIKEREGKHLLRLERWRRPSYYLPVAIALIMVLLALWGRSFAILCTSFGWYIAPKLTSSISTRQQTKKKKKKVYVTSDGLSSPKSKSCEISSSPCKHGHQKSW